MAKPDGAALEAAKKAVLSVRIVRGDKSISREIDTSKFSPTFLQLLREVATNDRLVDELNATSD